MTLKNTARVGSVLNYGVAGPNVAEETGIRVPPVVVHLQAAAAITAGDVVRVRPNVGGTGTTATDGEDYILDVCLLDLTVGGDEVSGHGYRGVALEDAAIGDLVKVQIQGVCQAAVAGTVAANKPLSHQGDGVFDEAATGEAIYGYALVARTGAGLTRCLVFPTPIGIADADFSD